MRTGHSRQWRKGSDYGAPPRNALDQHQRHVWRRRVVAEARAGNLPGKAILTAEAMLRCMGEDGALFPSYEALAEKAGVGQRTVARHLARMAELGLIRKHRRLVRMPWPEGGRGAVRVQQTSNAYELLFPARQVAHCLVLRRVVNTGCHSGRVEAGRGFIPAPEGDQVAARRALEAVRMARAMALGISP